MQFICYLFNGELPREGDYHREGPLVLRNSYYVIPTT
ncbi:MAG: hypothetical protein RI989_219 [Bacteroidota bacterium]|jgi:hypothetical protein